jgi:hypothetical protein
MKKTPKPDTKPPPKRPKAAKDANPPHERPDGRIQISLAIPRDLERACRKLGRVGHRSRNKQMEMMLEEWLLKNLDKLRELDR